MKKFSFFLNCAATALFAIALTACQDVKDNPSGEENPAKQTIEIKEGDELATIINQMAATAGDEIIVEIPAGIKTINADGVTVPAGKKLTIAGNKVVVVAVKNPIVFSNDITIKDISIDGSGTTSPIFKIDDAAPSDIFTIDNISFTGLVVDNLKSELFYANKKKVIVKNFAVDNSIIAVKGATKKTMFSFNGGGLPEAFSVNNSTLYADNASQWANGGFYSTQAGHKLSDLEIESNTISITNSTFYGICNKQHLSTLRQNSAKGQVYTVKNSIFVNCGKGGTQSELYVGLNGGAAGNDYNWDVDGNVAMFSGNFLPQKKIGKTDGLIKNPVEIDPGFNMPDRGFFHPTNKSFPTTVGDPRWFEDAAKWQ